MVPGELAPFRDLFRQLGVPEQFTAQQYAGVLASLARDLPKRSLPAKELEQAVAVVQVRNLGRIDRLAALPLRGMGFRSRIQTL